MVSPAPVPARSEWHILHFMHYAFIGFSPGTNGSVWSFRSLSLKCFIFFCSSFYSTGSVIWFGQSQYCVRAGWYLFWWVNYVQSFIVYKGVQLCVCVCFFFFISRILCVPLWTFMFLNLIHRVVGHFLLLLFVCITNAPLPPNK